MAASFTWSQSPALSADRLLVSSNAEAVAADSNGFDLMVDTVPVRCDLSPYLALLDVDRMSVIIDQVAPPPG
jgi:uncharacterized zinc-type alcohol dehydrogenase-like protein